MTVPEILETSEAKKNLAERSGALACDMESAHLYQVCCDAGIPMLAVRTISDTRDQDLPIPGSVLIDPETGRSNPSAIFRHLFRYPAKAAQFAKLVTDSRSAQQSLANTLGLILPLILKRSMSE